MNAIAHTPARRALLFDVAELELLERSLADFAIDAWGGPTRPPEFRTASEKINTALRSIDIERRQARLQ